MAGNHHVVLPRPEADTNQFGDSAGSSGIFLSCPRALPVSGAAIGAGILQILDSRKRSKPASGTTIGTTYTLIPMACTARQLASLRCPLRRAQQPWDPGHKSFDAVKPDDLIRARPHLDLVLLEGGLEDGLPEALGGGAQVPPRGPVLQRHVGQQHPLHRRQVDAHVLRLRRRRTVSARVRPRWKDSLAGERVQEASAGSNTGAGPGR